MDKKTLLKIGGVRSESAFYKLYPDEKSFMAKHGKKVKKALLGEQIKKAQAGDSQPYNQMGAGMNAMATSQNAVQGAIGNLSTGTPKKTTGQQIAGVVKDIPVLGGLVNSIVGLWSGDNARKERAGTLSDLQLRASNSAPRQQNRKYNRPDMDANVDDINQLMPAEGTGTNLLGRDGIILSKGGEIANTFAPNTIYSDGGYEPLNESERMKSYYRGGQVPQANFGSILSNVLSSSGGSGGGGGDGLVGNISGILGGILGGGTTAETTTINPYQYSRPYFGDQNYVNAQDGALINTLKPKLPAWAPEGNDTQLSKIQPLPTSSPAPINAPTVINQTPYKSSINGFAKRVSSVNDELRKYNAAQAAHNSASGFSSITGLDNKEAQGAGNIGSTVGSAFGPIGSVVGQVVGTGLGAILRKKGGDKAMARVQRNNDQMAMTQAAKANQQYQQSYMRTGGHLKQSPDMESSGELKPLWGGHAEPISYNPYLPEGGETVMFRGNSHEESDGRGRTGIGVRYGEGGDLQPYDANVEVERGEPAVQMPDETGEKNLVVFGNLPIPNQFVKQLGDPDAKGKKFKNYVALLSKQENKQNKIVEKASDELKELNPKTPYDKIKFDTLGIMLNGANMKLKDLADKKNNAAHLQQAINDTAEERGIDPEFLAKGTIKAMKGAKVPKAQDGMNAAFLKASPEERIKMMQGMVAQKDAERTGAESTGPLPSYKHTAQGKGKLDYSTPDEAGGIWKGESYEKVWKPKVDKLFGDRQKAEGLVHNLETYQGQDFADVRAILAKESTMEGKIKRAWDLAKDGRVGPYHQIVNSYADQSNKPDMGKPNLSFNPPKPSAIDLTPMNEPREPSLKKGMPQFINPMGNYLPPNKEELDPRQLTGEYYALATNQLEPVPAQQYHPNLRTPYELSLQDILNENQALTRSAQKFSGYNPAAQANLVAQQYGANAKVLGDQFRINQEFKDKIYGENTNILNDAQLKNLGIMDQQYQRQSKALSNTKDTAREALSSISDKYLRNKLENDTNATYQNLYNYRYDQNQHAWNMNGPAQWNMSGSGNEPYGWDQLTPAEKQLAVEDAQARKARREVSAEAKTKGRNGAILKMMKNL